MRRTHMRILWVVCMIAALALFWVGLGKPFMDARELAAEPEWLLPLSDPRVAELEKRKEAIKANYLVGAAAPAVILIGSMLIFTLVPGRD